MSDIPPPDVAAESPMATSEAAPSANLTGLDPGYDDADDDADSAYGAAIESSTASLEFSILQYRTLHGRTYHSERGNAEYWGANDEQQSISLDLFHHAFTLSLDDKLFLAPLKDPKKVLDIGTGTGLWAIDFADAYPNCTVIGTDISPIQPTWVPPNLMFEIEDYTSPWAFSSASFDYVHMRYLEGTIKDWTEVAKEAYKSLKPGGWIESLEASANFVSDDDSIPPNSAMAQWGPIFWKAGEQNDRSFRIYEDGIQMKCMKAAGFVDLHVKEFKYPFSPWSKDPKQREIGLLCMTSLLNDIRGFLLFVTSKLGWTKEEVVVYEAHLRKMLRSPKYHCYMAGRVVYGRKPLEYEVGC